MEKQLSGEQLNNLSEADLLIDQGNYTMTYGPDSTFEKGKYINVWKKVDGQWKIYSNMWNTNE